MASELASPGPPPDGEPVRAGLRGSPITGRTAVTEPRSLPGPRCWGDRDGGSLTVQRFNLVNCRRSARPIRSEAPGLAGLGQAESDPKPQPASDGAGRVPYRQI
eukprot:205047-Hanusia_phi.AAC.2